MFQIGYWLFGLEVSIIDFDSVKNIDHLSPDILTMDVHVTDSSKRQGMYVYYSK